MAYRTEKEANGKEAIVIDGWENGIAPDPYKGTNRMLQVNLSVPGEVSVGYPITVSTLSGGGSTLGRPVSGSTRYFAYGTPGIPVTGSARSYAILDINSRVWESPDGGALTGTFTYLASSNTTTSNASLGMQGDICYWLGRLFKTLDTKIYYWNGSTWADWTSSASLPVLASAETHKMWVGLGDNNLYIGNRMNLVQISVDDPTAFDPTNSATYNYVEAVIQIALTDVIISFSELGAGNTAQSTLFIGGSQNQVYPWDFLSPFYNLPLYVPDPYIKNMVSVNSNLYIFTGNQNGVGKIFISSAGAQATEFFKIPDYLFNINTPYFIWGDAAVSRNQLLFGFSVSQNSLSSLVLSSELWALDLDLEEKQFKSISSLPSNTGKGNATVILPGISQTGTPGYNLIVGVDTSDDVTAVQNIGYSGTTSGIGSSTVTTDYIPVGSLFQKATYSEIEFKLRSPLESGESIVITPIVDGTFGSPLSFLPTGTGQISGVAPVNFEKCQWLQFNITSTGNSATSGVRLREIRIR